MKHKMSITLSEAVLRAVDRRAERFRNNRSGFIERAVRSYLADLDRKERDAEELARINRHAARLNQEAEDVLAYQVIP